MTTYIIKRMGGGVIFLNGDLGPHCTGCMAPSEYLCDFPVGDGLTCDRPMCGEHSKQVLSNTHYCEDHAPMWEAFAEGQGIRDALANVVPFRKLSGRAGQ